MEVERLAEGLWRWSVEPGRWSIYAETPRAILLVDPLLPAPGSNDEDRFFEALDRDVARCERPVFVVETSVGRAHDAVRIHDRYRPSRDDAGREEDDRDPDEARD
ncbi:MAG TPA: hypothetical protein VHZ31_02450 [Solirubrobacteraceae bacterium]|jgi:hypothetical protein|nr:hypothetical protein [Solirubrobacteraceae bacterium]